VVALVAVVLLGAAIWWTGRFRDTTAAAQQAWPDPDAAAPSMVGNAPSVVGNAPSGSGAGDAAPVDVVPTGPPPNIIWRVWHAVALPYSPTAGPSRGKAQIAAGFAHTPTGALIAAVHASTRCTAATDPGWQDVLATMAAPGPGRDAFAAARATVTHPQPAGPGTFGQLAGFQFIGYTPADAMVQLVFRDPDGGLAVTAEHVTWRDGDWKLVFAADGSEAPSKQRVDSLAGFITWGGV
jgi:hypothetical protein